jgi:hypothetical protein
MRMLSLELWQKWEMIRPHFRHSELGLDGTNNALGRTIGMSKLRYKTMRGYNSEEAMRNGMGLTQWLTVTHIALPCSFAENRAY